MITHRVAGAPLDFARLREELAQPGNLIGESAAMAELRKLVARAGPSDSVVLVEGGTGTGKERVARGGAWSTQPKFCRSAFRDWHEPGYRSDCVGFRVVVTAGR